MDTADDDKIYDIRQTVGMVFQNPDNQIVATDVYKRQVPSSPSAELPINKKRTRTLFRKESGSSTNCMVDLSLIHISRGQKRC